MKQMLRQVVRKISAPREEAPAPSVRTLFFISGHPRSGTNWLSNLCNLHPRVCCHGEFHFQVLYDALDHFTDFPWYVASKPKIRRVAEEGIESTVRRCMAAMGAQRKPGADVVGDHTPREFRVFIPDAKYVWIARDGRDVSVSWTFHLLNTGRPALVRPRVRELFDRELEASDGSPEGVKRAAANLLASEAWVEAVAEGWAERIRRDLPKVRAAESEGGALVLRYEDLLEDTDRWRGELYRFLGVDPSEAEPLSQETNTTPGFGKENPKGFFRKGASGDWRNYFDSEAQSWFKRAAGNELLELKYETDADW